MTTVIINEKSKQGKSLLEFLKNTNYAKVIENTSAINSIEKSLSELKKIKEGTLIGKPARDLLDEL